MAKVVKWYKPKRESGFRKEASVESNLRTMYKHCAKNLTPKSCWRRVGRQAQALSNVTKDVATKKKAKSVAVAAFKKLE